MNILFCNNGIGDKLVDIIGFSTYCKIKNINYKIILNDIIKDYNFGMKNFYNSNLFNFEDIKVNNNYIDDDIKVIIIPQKFNKNNKNYNIKGLENNPNDYILTDIIKKKDINKEYFWQTGTYNIPIIYDKLKNDYSLEYIVKIYIENAEKIKPSKYIENLIPKNMEKCYGIHLRRSDKIKKDKKFLEKKNINSHIFVNSFDEYNSIIKKTKEYILNLINNEKEATFFICSEDIEYKEYFKKWINDNNGKIIDLNISENKNNKELLCILDLFCLSKCKSIIQGIKYSSFSIVASLIGKKKIINFFDKEDNLINIFNSAISINGKYNFDINDCLKLLIKTFPQ